MESPPSRLLFTTLPRNSNLVLLMDTGAGLVGAGEELNSLVGVSCCNETEA